MVNRVYIYRLDNIEINNAVLTECVTPYFQVVINHTKA